MEPKGVPYFEQILMFDLYDRLPSTEDITTDFRLYLGEIFYLRIFIGFRFESLIRI